MWLSEASERDLNDALVHRAAIVCVTEHTMIDLKPTEDTEIVKTVISCIERVGGKPVWIRSTIGDTFPRWVPPQDVVRTCTRKGNFVFPPPMKPLDPWDIGQILTQFLEFDARWSMSLVERFMAIRRHVWINTPCVVNH